jgi:Pup amidohydrolase
VAITKYMGTETEFGISVIGRPDFNPVLASSMVVNAYSADGRHRARWDYEEENPLRDARGFTQPGAHEPPPEDDIGLANSILTNGARFYVDHAHPEYSSPECSNPRDLVIWDKAGERILEIAAEKAGEVLAREHDRPGRILITKNNTDGKGAAYGMHENYIVARQVPFGELVRQITPFFVTRQIMVGAGRIGNEFEYDDVPYQISQRADFFEVEVGLETTLKRPIVNTRDEPHADPDRFRRLHVIIGDANMSEVCTYLKLGSTALVLCMIEDDFLPEAPSIAQPVKSLHAVSHDLTCRKTVELKDGSRVTPVELQWHYLEQAKRYCKVADDPPDWAPDLLATWERILTSVEEDPMSLDGVVDWVTKYRLMRRFIDRDGLDWSADKLKVVDVQYHDVRREGGLYNKLVAGGRVERLVSEEEVTHAIGNPPPDTRAYFRGRCLEKYRDQVTAAGWDSIIFDVGRETLQRVPMMDPGRGGRDMTGSLIDRCATAGELLDELQG